MQRRLGVALALLLILGGLMLWRWSQQPPAPSPEPSNSGLTMTAYARDVQLMATDEQGREAWRVSAPAARYFQASDLWQLDSPTWLIQTEQGTPWYGRADQARSWDNEQQARLTGNVRLHQSHPEGDTVMTTDWIDMQLPQRYAETTAAVSLNSPSYRINALGARAWLAEERIELTDNARGRYEASN